MAANDFSDVFFIEDFSNLKKRNKIWVEGKSSECEWIDEDDGPLRSDRPSFVGEVLSLNKTAK